MLPLLQRKGVQRMTLLALFLGLVATVLLLQYDTPALLDTVRAKASKHIITALEGTSTKAESDPASTTQALTSPTPISNNVHYVWLMQEPEADLSFSFTDFLSVWSAYHHLAHATIYIHTDATSSALARARTHEAATLWTRLIFSIPSVHTHPITAPYYFKDCDPPQEITIIQHRSDVVRVDLLHEYGGLYIDFDVYVIRDVKPLRQRGYQNVFGRELYGLINNGAFMAAEGSKIMTTWRGNMSLYYDGGWTTIGNTLVTRLVEEVVHGISADAAEEEDKKVSGGHDGSETSEGEEKEVLIMDVEAFHPVSWEPGHREELHHKHNSTPSSEPDTYPPKDNSWMYLGKELSRKEEWDRDWDQTYMIHAFEADSEGYEGSVFTVRNILKRQSRLGRALWPALKAAFEEGFIPWDEVMEADRW